MKTISLCMIVKDEEKVIGNCLSSIHDLVDEIIIVDTGSTDKTKEICKLFTDKIYDFEWNYDFSSARNYSFSHATSDYIMWLDADDILKEEDRIKLKKLKEEMDGSIDVYSLIYNYRHNEEGKCIYSFMRERILKNNDKLYWTCIVHELLNYDEPKQSIDTDIIVTHTSNHDNGKTYIDFFEKKISMGHNLISREKYYFGGELVVFNYIDRAIEILESFVSDKDYDNKYELSRGYNYLGYCYKKKEEYEKSIINYFCQIACNEPDMNTYYEIADSFYTIKDYKNAIFYYNLVINMDFPKEKFINNSEYDINNKVNFINKLKVNSYFALCLIYFNLNELEKSIFCNNKILEIEPNNENALYNKNFFEQYCKNK